MPLIVLWWGKGYFVEMISGVNAPYQLISLRDILDICALKVMKKVQKDEAVLHSYVRVTAFLVVQISSQFYKYAKTAVLKYVIFIRRCILSTKLCFGEV